MNVRIGAYREFRHHGLVGALWKGLGLLLTGRVPPELTREALTQAIQRSDARVPVWAAGGTVGTAALEARPEALWAVDVSTAEMTLQRHRFLVPMIQTDRWGRLPKIVMLLLERQETAHVWQPMVIERPEDDRLTA